LFNAIHKHRLILIRAAAKTEACVAGRKLPMQRMRLLPARDGSDTSAD
jgi:hypothetical protein